MANLTQKLGNYEVDYGKPTVQTPFHKGKSSNTKGFPKGEQRLKFVLMRMLAMPFSKVQKVLKAVPDDRVQIYVIWDPIFGGDFDGEAKKLSLSYPDKRVSYYKDPESLAGNLWKGVLKVEMGIAWDVYMLYGADAESGSEPPQPDYWMHQLSWVKTAPHLDEGKLTEELKSLVKKVEPKESKEERK